jgi:hypothetical protein
MLGPDDGGLCEKHVTDSRLDVFDLLNGLLFREPVEKEINIRGRAELLMVELTKRTLGAVILVRNWKQGVNNG